MDVETILEQQFLGEKFTSFAVMSLASGVERPVWKKEFHNMIDTGVIIKVEEKLLGDVYRVAAKVF